MWNFEEGGKLLDVFRRGLCLAVEDSSRRYLIAANVISDFLKAELLGRLGLEQRLRRCWKVGVLTGLL